jgi:ABC-type cobalamin transport system permease subunit
VTEGRAGAGVFSDTLDIRKYALSTVLQTEVYAILAWSDYCLSMNMYNMTICICSDSKQQDEIVLGAENGFGLPLLWTRTLCSTVSFNCPGYE